MNTTCTHETHYPTDMTDAEWALVAPYVAPDPPIGAPRDVCMRCVVNALFYWVKTGCQWKMLPTNFPNYGTVYHHFRRWSADGTLEQIAHDLQRAVRRDAGRDPEPSRGIVDSQSAPTAEAGGERDFDAAKQVNGRKRFIITDTLGLLLTVVITQAALSGYPLGDGERRAPGPPAWASTAAPPAGGGLGLQSGVSCLMAAGTWDSGRNGQAKVARIPTAADSLDCRAHLWLVELLSTPPGGV